MIKLINSKKIIWGRKEGKWTKKMIKVDEIIEVIKEPKVDESKFVETKPIEAKPEIKVVQVE